MTRRASRYSLGFFAFVTAVAALGPARAHAAPADELPSDGQNALKDEFDKAAPLWTRLIGGAEVADPANPQHQQAVDAAAKWTTYRLTWGVVSDPGKVTDLFREFNDSLALLRVGRDKTQKAAEMYVKQLIVHAQEVLQTRKPIARINAARLLARVTDRANDETPPDVVVRLGANQGDLADALAAAIKDPNQIDAARLYLFRAMRNLLALPQAMPPVLPREKEEAAVGAVIKYLQDHNKPFTPGTPQDEIDGFRYVRREAIKALAQCHFPSLADKARPALVLLKVVARDGVDPEPRLDERVEAAVGVARMQADLDKDYQPDYAAHQLGLFVANYVAHYAQEKQAAPPQPSLSWKVDASRLIEALEFMKVQTKNAHVTLVADESTKYLTPLEKAIVGGPNVSELEQKLQGTDSPGKSLFKSDPQSVVKPANRPDEAPTAPPVQPEEKKDK